MFKLIHRVLCVFWIHDYSTIIKTDDYAVRQCYYCKKLQTRFGRDRWHDGYYWYDL